MSEVNYSVGEHDTRPWGNWTVVATGQGYIIKQIEVLPGKKLSLQSHSHRSEHWIVLKGDAEVTVGDEKVALAENGQVFIPPQTKHRIHNSGSDLLSFIEVQIGSRLDEGDIIRFEDDYGRA